MNYEESVEKSKVLRFQASKGRGLEEEGKNGVWRMKEVKSSWVVVAWRWRVWF